MANGAPPNDACCSRSFSVLCMRFGWALDCGRPCGLQPFVHIEWYDVVSVFEPERF